MGKNPLTTPPLEDPAPVEPENVTAPVTEPTGPAPPWQLAGLTEEQWNDLEIPAFLVRVPPSPSPTPSTTAIAAAAAATAGGPSGGSTKPASVAGVTGDFSQFRVDPNEIESKIKAEADKLWRNWVPTKTDRKRPRIGTYIKRVRKLYYP